MSKSRIRIKFPEHEFEVEGPAERVQSRFAVFRRLVWPNSEPDAAETMAQTTIETVEIAPAEPPFPKMCLQQGRFLFLKVPAKVEDAVLLVMFAQKEFRKNENVTGGEIMGGLRRSGIKIRRADSLVTKHESAGNIAIKGSGRTRRYQLTDQGAYRAQQLVSYLAPLVDTKPVQ